MAVLQQPYPHKMTTLYTGVIGTLFNDMKISRDDGKVVKVPLWFSNKNKSNTRRKENEDPTGKRTRRNLPALGLEFNGWEKDTSRQTSRYNILQSATADRETASTIPVQYNKTPYKFMYTLSIAAKNYEDLFQITEYILATFNPSIEVVVKDNPDLDMETGVSVRLVSTDFSDEYQGAFDQYNDLQVNMQFELDGFILQPMYNSSIIKTINLNYSDIDFEQQVETQVITG